MRRYEKYRDSGVEWIGEIPEHWEVRKLKWVISEKLKYGANESAELDNPNYPRYIRITDFSSEGKLKDDTFKSLLPEKAKEYILKKGDVLFARSGATYGKTFLFNEGNMQACYAGYLIKATPKTSIILPEYLYFYTKSGSYDNWKNSVFIQATIQNIGADKYSTLPFSVPTLPEQTAIVNFLNYETHKIDHIITTRQKQIELLKELKSSMISRAVTKGIDPNVKMKDSGVEWIGEIPEHWEIMRLKYVVNMKSGDGITSEMIKEEEKYPVYGGNGLRGYFNSFTHDGTFILIGRQGALCGNINYATEKFWASEHALVCTPKIKVVINWLGELLRVMNLNQYSVSAAQPGLSVENLKTLQIPFPRLSEQHQIVSHIEKRTAKIDTAISKYQRQIELLKEYRASLITEAVTGKIDVRGEIGEYGREENIAIIEIFNEDNNIF